MNYLKLTPEKLSLEAISDQVSHESCGAISMFVGTTRDSFQNKKVLSLEYEAYEPMAIKQMERICHFIRERWPDVENIAIYHRLGTVPVREASVVIAISSPHRQEALDAVSYAIEELKKLVPIWKKEKYEFDESAWKENKESSKENRMNFSSLTELALIPIELVQITADDSEINRRIKCFVEKKREEIDMSNIADYTECFHRSDMSDEHKRESTCARTNSFITKQEDSSCHLRVRRVKNRIGPQITEDYLETLNKLMSKKKKLNLQVKMESPDLNDDTHIQNSSKLALNKRLYQAENYFNITMDNRRHIYKRIKAIENRILFLESISPEYKHFLKERISSPILDAVKPVKFNWPQRKIYSIGEMDSIIEQLTQNDSNEEKKLHN